LHTSVNVGATLLCDLPAFCLSLLLHQRKIILSDDTDSENEVRSSTVRLLSDPSLTVVIALAAGAKRGNQKKEA
jgi:hypothetical protein